MECNKDFYSEARIGDNDYTMWSCDMSRLFDDNGNIDEQKLEDNPYFKASK